MNAHSEKGGGSVSDFCPFVMPVMWRPFPPGKQKGKKRKINPNTNDVCYAHLFTTWSPNAVRSSVRSISDRHKSKTSLFQDRSLSWTQGKTSFVSMWSQDEESSLRGWACFSRHSLRKISSLKCKPSRVSGLDVDAEIFAASGHDEFWFHVGLDVGLPHGVLKVEVQGALAGHTAVAVAPSRLAVGEPVVRGARVPASLPAQALLLHEKLQPLHLAARGPVLRLTQSIACGTKKSVNSFLSDFSIKNVHIHLSVKIVPQK